MSQASIKSTTRTDSPTLTEPPTPTEPRTLPKFESSPSSEHVFECQQCGSRLVVVEQQRSFTCPFCESNVVVEHPADRPGRLNPDFVIPFAIDPRAAAEIFQKWIHRNDWLRPGDLGTAQIESQLRGVYLPFWVFSVLAESDWSANIGEYWYRTEHYTVRDKDGKTRTVTRTVQETEWWPLAGQHHRYHTGYMVSASRGLTQTEADSIKPFHLAGCQRYQAYFLAGWACEEYSVDKELAVQVSRQYFLSQEEQHVRAFLPGDTYSGLHVQSTLRNVDTDLVFLPIYLLKYQYRGKSFRFLINGQTGQVVGEKPVSNWRIAIAVALGIAICLLIVMLFRYLRTQPVQWTF